MGLKLQDEMIEHCSAYLPDYSAVPLAQNLPCSLTASAYLLDYHEIDPDRSELIVAASALAVLASSACDYLRNL